MKYKKSLYLLAAALLVTGCSEQEVPVYGEDAIVNDIYGESQSQASVRFLASVLNHDELELGGSNYDSASKTYLDTWSFSLDPMAEDYVLEVPLALMGTVVDKDRQVAYTIDNTMEIMDEEGNPVTVETAPEGSYEVLEAVIPANEKYGYIRIKLNNVPELAEDTYEMSIKIDNSQDLLKGPKEYITAHISWDNKIQAPPSNNYRRSYNMLIKGLANFIATQATVYSPNALKAIVSALGWNDWDDYEAHKNKEGMAAAYYIYRYLPHYAILYQLNTYKYYAAKLDAWLKAYEEEHGEPLLHDAGSLKGQPVEARQY